jgi:hypothetical protein
MENLGRVQADVHPRLAGPAALRAKLLLREHFGDLDAARDVLERLTTALHELGQPEPVRGDIEALDATTPADTEGEAARSGSGACVPRKRLSNRQR